MEHRGSKETHEYIADWIAPNFFFSIRDVWHRMGILGVFGDYVLSCTQGCIVEIGCGESSIYLSHLARKYSRKIYHCDIAPDKIINPLTIAGYMTEHALDMAHSMGQLEQRNSLFFIGSSDDLFKNANPTNIALSFIDGDHNYDQAKKDFDNLFERTVDNGYICLHDTYPPDPSYLPDNRCGDVYRLRQELEKNPRINTITLPRGTAMGVGFTICRKKPAKLEYYNE